MQPRHYLVEEWKAKLAASAVSPEEQDRRFTWIRTIYSRVYRFLLAFYGDGEWRGVDTDGSTEQSASRMPFVEVGVWIEGARPKSRESIRQTLASIHDSNPGLAVAGTTAGVDEDTWVVVAARKKSSAVRAVLRRLAPSAPIPTEVGEVAPTKFGAPAPFPTLYNCDRAVKGLGVPLRGMEEMIEATYASCRAHGHLP